MDISSTADAGDDSVEAHSRTGSLRDHWASPFLAATAFFLLLCSYYILRPVRDEMAVQTGANRVPWLFTGTLLCTLAVVPLFGWIVKRCAKGWLVPLVYGAMGLCLLGFFVAFSTGITKPAAATFFIWLSLFNLMVISLFWSSVSDAFTTGQAQRYYGYIAAGGTAGAIAGPALTASIAKQISTANLLLISGILLAFAMCGLVALRRVSQGTDQESRRPIGGPILAGITETFRNIRLRGLAGLVICYSAVSTVLYLEMTDLAGKVFSNPEQRIEFFARIDLVANTLALSLQLLVTRPIVQRAGLGWALMLAPLVLLPGLAMLALWPTILLLAAVQVIHRAGEFSLSKPGREILFTTVDVENRYKAKNFIDTAIYRANDAGSAWIATAIRTAGFSAVWWLAVPTAIAWTLLGRRLGRPHSVDAIEDEVATSREDETSLRN